MEGDGEAPNDDRGKQLKKRIAFRLSLTNNMYNEIAHRLRNYPDQEEEDQEPLWTVQSEVY